MLNSEFINRAIDLVVVKADNGLYYLEPTWKNILKDNKLIIKDISDVKTNLSEVEDVLKLEVEKRNIQNSKEPYVFDWLYDLIYSQIEPTILEEETEYIKNLTEYLKTNHEAQTLKK